MPTYAYACKQCGHRFDAVQSFTDAALTVCPNCGGGPLRKQYGSIGVTFSGPGFYRTDSRSGAAAGGADRSGSGGDGGDKGGASSGDTSGGSGGDAGAASGGGNGTAAASSTPASSPAPPSGS